MRKNIIILAMALLGVANFSKAESVVIEDFTITCGETMTVTLNLNNSRSDLTAFEFTLTLPEGLTLDTENCQLTDRYPGMLVIGTPEENVYKLCGYSGNLDVITGKSGALIELPITAAATFRGGTMTLTDGYLISTARQRYNVNDSETAVAFQLNPGQLLGDVNNDGYVNVTDVMLTVNFVVGQNPAGFIEANADMNADGTITVTDVIAIVNIAVSGN